jgi:hypothetical protein
VTEITDENGFYTGEDEIIYTTPQSAKVNVSASRGEASVELFGTDLNYTKTIVTDKDLGIDEHSILWLGKSYTTPHNYIVVSVAKSINCVSYAIREVDVSPVLPTPSVVTPIEEEENEENQG